MGFKKDLNISQGLARKTVIISKNWNNFTYQKYQA